MNAAVLRHTVIVLGILSLLGSAARAKKLASVKEIDGEPVHRVLGKDAIPSIDKPKFASGDRATRTTTATSAASASTAGATPTSACRPRLWSTVWRATGMRR